MLRLLRIFLGKILSLMTPSDAILMSVARNPHADRLLQFLLRKVVLVITLIYLTLGITAALHDDEKYADDLGPADANYLNFSTLVICVFLLPLFMLMWYFGWIPIGTTAFVLASIAIFFLPPILVLSWCELALRESRGNDLE